MFPKKGNDEKKNNMIEGKLALHVQCRCHLEFEVCRGEGEEWKGELR